MGWSEYKIYTDKLAELTSIFDELIYLTDNFDIKRLNKFLINIIENHDFYILEDENNEYSDGYSDLEDEYKLSRDILETDEYINMMEYINENFLKMYEKYLLFINKIDSLTSLYLEDLRLVNVDIIENFRTEYDAVIFKLELLQLKLSKIPNEENKDNIEKKSNLNINVLLITNNSIMYGIGYKFFKKYLNKNLHVIRKDTYEITYSDEKEFNNKINNIYSNIYNTFIDTLINGKAKNFNEKFLLDLKENIRKYKVKSKEEGDKALTAIEGTNKLAKDEENSDKLKKKEWEENDKKRRQQTEENDDKIDEAARQKQINEQKEAMKQRDKIKEGIENLTKSKKKEAEKEAEKGPEKEAKKGPEKEAEKEEVVGEKEAEGEAKKEKAKEDAEAGEGKPEEEAKPEIKVPDEEDILIKKFIELLTLFNSGIKQQPDMGNLNVNPEQKHIYKQFQPWFEKQFPDLKNKIGDIKPLSSSPINTDDKSLPPAPILLPLNHLSPSPQQPSFPQGRPYPGSPLPGSPLPGSPLPSYLPGSPQQPGYPQGRPYPGSQPGSPQQPGYLQGSPPPGYPQGGPYPGSQQGFPPQQQGFPSSGFPPSGFPPHQLFQREYSPYQLYRGNGENVMYSG
jgi:hypothetical protein